MIDRRSFLLSTSAIALGAVPAGRFLAPVPEEGPPLDRLFDWQGADPLRNMVVVNGLGSLDEAWRLGIPA